MQMIRENAVAGSFELSQMLQDLTFHSLAHMVAMLVIGEGPGLHLFIELGKSGDHIFPYLRILLHELGDKPVK